MTILTLKELNKQSAALSKKRDTQAKALEQIRGASPPDFTVQPWPSAQGLYAHIPESQRLAQNTYMVFNFFRASHQGWCDLEQILGMQIKLMKAWDFDVVAQPVTEQTDTARKKQLEQATQQTSSIAMVEVQKIHDQLVSLIEVSADNLKIRKLSPLSASDDIATLVSGIESKMQSGRPLEQVSKEHLFPVKMRTAQVVNHLAELYLWALDIQYGYVSQTAEPLSDEQKEEISRDLEHHMVNVKSLLRFSTQLLSNLNIVVDLAKTITPDSVPEKDSRPKPRS